MGYLVAKNAWKSASALRDGRQPGAARREGYALDALRGYGPRRFSAVVPIANERRA
jgi:hypothetical protein